MNRELLLKIIFLKVVPQIMFSKKVKFKNANINIVFLAPSKTLCKEFLGDVRRSDQILNFLGNMKKRGKKKTENCAVIKPHLAKKSYRLNLILRH